MKINGTQNLYVPIDFGNMNKNSNNTFEKFFFFVLCRRKKDMNIWNDMRVSK